MLSFRLSLSLCLSLSFSRSLSLSVTAFQGQHLINAIRKNGLSYVMLNEGSLYHDVRVILISVSVSFMFKTFKIEAAKW